MLRTTLAAIALTALLASAGQAGDCLCGGGHHGAQTWDNYCGGDDGCGHNDACDCQRCCFPLVHGVLNRVGRVFDCLIPDPCCRRSCCYSPPTIGCCQPACGAMGHESMPAMDPFIDDHHQGPPTPLPDKDARSRAIWGTPKMTYRSTPTIMTRPAMQPKPTATAPMKTAVTKPRSATKSATNGKPLGKSVLKVAYEEEEVDASASDDLDAPPAAPASVRNADRDEQSQSRFAAKPVVRAGQSQMPANPLRR